MEMSNQNQLITTLHQGLQQTRGQQGRLLARLQEIESEAEALRQEFEDLEKFANQTEEAIINLVGKSRGKGKSQLNFPVPQKLEDGMPMDGRSAPRLGRPGPMNGPGVSWSEATAAPRTRVFLTSRQANSSGRPPTKAGGTIRVGLEGKHGRFTALLLPTNSPATIDS